MGKSYVRFVMYYFNLTTKQAFVSVRTAKDMNS